MALRYLLDENLRGTLWYAILRFNAQAREPVDVVRVGDPPDLPLSTSDPDILVWAGRQGRVLVSYDHDTMPGFFWDHLGTGGELPGLFLVRPRSRIPDLLAWLVAAAYSGDDDQWRDQITYIP